MSGSSRPQYEVLSVLGCTLDRWSWQWHYFVIHHMSQQWKEGLPFQDSEAFEMDDCGLGGRGSAWWAVASSPLPLLLDSVWQVWYDMILPACNDDKCWIAPIKQMCPASKLNLLW
ncbi:hypothetical protein AOLI_G00106220 [Acnodon oligacanthus]